MSATPPKPIATPIHWRPERRSPSQNRDISAVHFWDPEAEEYFGVPYRDTSHPAISVWELREIRRQFKQQGRESIDFKRLDFRRVHYQIAGLANGIHGGGGSTPE